MIYANYSWVMFHACGIKNGIEKMVGTYFICLTIVLFPDSPAPENCKVENGHVLIINLKHFTLHFYSTQH